MIASAHRPPWTAGAAAVICVTGTVLLLAALIGSGPGLLWSSAALVAAAMLELAAGISLMRHHGASISHIFGGAVALAFVGFLVVAVIIDPSAASAAPIALAIGVYYLVDAIVRLLDVAIDRPRDALTESIDAVVMVVLAVVLLARWRAATAGFVATVVGIELIVRGLALFGSARVVWRHPELTPYDGLQDRLEPLAPTVARQNPTEQLI